MNDAGKNRVRIGRARPKMAEKENGMEQNKTEQNVQQETALAVSPAVDDSGITAQLTSRKQVFCSVQADTAKGKTVMFKAMNNPDFRIADMINQTISVKDVYAEMIEITHEETGEIETAPRIVLIDADGKGYQAVSSGIFGALKKLIAVFGAPTWETPIKLKILQIERKGKRILSFDVV